MLFRGGATLLVVSALLCAACGDDGSGGGGAGGGSGGGGGADDGGGGSGSGLDDAYPLADPEQFPEGIAFDPESQSFFVGSLALGTVTRVSATTGEETIFYEGDPDGARGTLGLEVDEARRRLWACAVDPETFAGWVWLFDLDSGERLANLELEGTFAGGSCNDVAVDADGRAYVTDRENPNIYTVDAAGAGAEIWATDDLLSGAVGLNGIEVTPDGAYVLANTYLAARVVRVSTSDPTEVVEVELTGEPFAGSGSLAGADGSTFLGDALYIAFPNEIMQLVPGDATWASAEVKAAPAGPGLTAVVVAEGDLYGSNGQSVTFLGGAEPEPFVIERIDVSGFAP